MKQRLVGTLVLGSLALIVIPLLLDGEGVDRPPLSATIPPAPVIDTTPLPDPIRPEIIDDSLRPAISPLDADTAGVPDALDAAVEEVLAEATASADATTDTAIEIEPEASAEEAEEVAIVESAPEAAPAQSTSTPALAASGLPEGWIVRLGAFRDRANADALVTRLVAAGHKAYIRPVMSGNVALSGVFVGPVPTRNEASTLQNELKSRFQINDAIVQRYDISQ